MSKRLFGAAILLSIDKDSARRVQSNVKCKAFYGCYAEPQPILCNKTHILADFVVYKQ